ncbi:hypothetical protein P8452_50719 [Trifolium repens]|nr:hypothetical protein P8452_50719 [Trifolium repens]
MNLRQQWLLCSGLFPNPDLGIVFDTDVDRSAVVDSTGCEFNRNRLIGLMAVVVLEEQVEAEHESIKHIRPNFSGGARTISWGGRDWRLLYVVVLVDLSCIVWYGDSSMDGYGSKIRDKVEDTDCLII